MSAFANGGERLVPKEPKEPLEPKEPKEPKERPLDRLAPGENGRIARIDAEPAITRRLMELGLVPGTEIVMVRSAPLGDPLEVAVRGLHLSLRRSEAGHIHVAPR